MRICSLLPSGTEIVAALGLADLLVGVSAECDFPPEVRRLPVVTASRIDTSTLSVLDVDRAVREAVADGRSLYAVDERLLESLSPDLVITQDLCEVCAVSSGDVTAAVRSLDAEVVSFDPRTIGEIEQSVVELAERLGVPERGRTVVEAMEEKLDRVRDQVRDLPPRRVFVAEWLDPPYAAGHWLPEMVDVAGGVDVLGRAGEPSYPTSWDAVSERDPELVVLAPCGLDAARAASEARPPLACRTVAVDANAYYSRPAPRIAEGVAQLAFLLHPEAVQDPGLPWRELPAPVLS
jgi:iron complex transport system substrate-binding protein